MHPRIPVSLIGIVLSASASSALAVGLDRVPDGLTGSDWSGIRAAHEANRHAAYAVEGGYQARNPGQQWRTRFDGRGFTTTPDAGAWEWGLELVGYGRAEQSPDRQGGVPSRARRPSHSQHDRSLTLDIASQRRGQAVAALSACGQRVEYEWDETLTEWYVNDGRGLEHGYTVHRRPSEDQSPDRKGGVKSRARGPSHSRDNRSLTVAALNITLAVRGDLRPQVSGDGRAVTFVNDTGAAVVNYSGLTVFDAKGVMVPAWFEVSVQWSVVSDQSKKGIPQSAFDNPQFISIVVDDRGATYPLTIDPIAQQAYLKASNTGAEDRFGFSVAMSGDTVVVGADREDSSATGVNGNQGNSILNAGAAYVFVRDGPTWSQQAYLKASNTGGNDLFGWSVAVSGDTVVVGAWQEDSSATGVNGNQGDNSAFASGAAYVFVRSATTWGQQAYLKASNTGPGDEFGWSVAVSGDTVVVGADQEDSSATGVNGNQADNSLVSPGATYVFVRSGTTWTQQAYLKASNTGAGDAFGLSVAVSGDTVVVGAPGEASSATGVNGNQADDSAFGAGATYVFVRSGTTWSQQAYLKASNTGANDQFGYSVSVSGDTVVVGAPFEDSSATGVNGDQADNSATSSGAAYVFVRSGTTWSQQAYLKASNTGTQKSGGDNFGFSAAVSGDTVVVGAYVEASSATGVNGSQADNSAFAAGAAYVFVRGGTTWSQQAYLKASNTEANDYFGTSVAVSGDTVVVGANEEDSNATGVNGNQADNSASSAGAAYVFGLRRIPPTTPAALSPD